MRLILEKNEIIAILGKHFEAELDPEKVLIRTDPLEIEVCGLPLGSGEPVQPRQESNVVALPQVTKFTPKKEEQLVPRDDADASTEPPEPGTDGVQPAGADFHPAAVLAASKELERTLDKENPQLQRRSGRWSETPPKSSDDEI